MALFDLLGRAWAMGVIWQLDDGPLSFRQLQARCGDMSPSLLNRRLKELRTTGLADLGDEGFALTPLGAELFELLEHIGTWAKHWADEIQ